MKVNGYMLTSSLVYRVHSRCDVAELAILESTDDAVVLRDVGKRQVVTITVPHSDASSYHTLVRS